MQVISARDIHQLLDWGGVLEALHSAHLGARPDGGSYYVGDSAYGLFSRGVILPGSGAGFKVCSIHPANSLATPPRPVEDAAFIVVDEQTKAISAVLDGPAITRWKTAADSALAARRLSRDDSEVLLVLGAGPVAQALVDAYLHIRPSLKQVLLWNRTPARLADTVQRLKDRGIAVQVVDDLNAAVARADIISAATGSATPLIHADQVRPGTHVDLVGGYRPDMQEADSEVLRYARIFVDDRNSALGSGDLQIPLQAGIIDETRIEADLFELCQNGSFNRRAEDITVYKNAGGAHLDLAVSQYVIRQVLGQ